METEKEIKRDCMTCKYRDTIFAPPPSIERMNLCRRFPPVTTVMPGPQGFAVGSSFPAVGPDVWCHEWTAEPAANKLLDG